jgi:hypothetical protein
MIRRFGGTCCLHVKGDTVYFRWMPKLCGTERSIRVIADCYRSAGFKPWPVHHVSLRPISCFSSLSTCICRDNLWNYTTAAFCHILSNSSFSIVTVLRPWRTGIRIPTGTSYSSPIWNVQSAFEAKPAHLFNGYLRFFAGCNLLKTKFRLLYLKAQLVPRRKHFYSRF